MSDCSCFAALVVRRAGTTTRKIEVGFMNTIPKLFVDPSWQAIINLPAGELIELIMFGVVSLLWIAGMCYGIYKMFSRKSRG